MFSGEVWSYFSNFRNNPFNQKVMETKATHGFKIDAGQDRFNEKITFLGGTFECKVASMDSREGLSVYDTTKMTKGGPPELLLQNDMRSRVGRYRWLVIAIADK